MWRRHLVLYIALQQTVPVVPLAVYTPSAPPHICCCAKAASAALVAPNATEYHGRTLVLLILRCGTFDKTIITRNNDAISA